MILLCLIFVLSITQQISTEENNGSNITVLSVQPDTNLSQRLSHGIKRDFLVQKGGKAPEYDRSEDTFNQASTHGKTKKKNIEPKNHKLIEKTNKEGNLEMKTRTNRKLQRNPKTELRRKPRRRKIFDFGFNENESSISSSSEEDKPEIYKKGYNSTIPRSKSDCCNAEIINIFHEMDLEARHTCFKIKHVLEMSLERQYKKRACIAECVAIHNRYLTKDDNLFVNEYANNLKYAFRELTWTTEIMDAIVNSCVDKYEFHSKFSLGCNTKMYDIGVCIGRKLQFECYENYLDKDSSEDKCNQDLLDVTYSKCTNQSPGYGCHVIR